jgi:hypothetical protein
MKKLLGIAVLGFMFNSIAYAKDVKLICIDTKDEGVSHILLINDKKKMLKVEDVPGVYDTMDVGIYNKDEIDGNKISKVSGKVIQQMNYNIDRRTGVLTLTSFFFDDGSMYRHKSNCKLFKENKF